MKRVLIAAVIAGSLGASASGQGRGGQQPAPKPLPPDAPKLLVVLVLDQFRADYIDLYSHQWTKGLRRLVDGGALFTRNAYPYAATYTCAGHATMSTGAFPAAHGMSSNEFYDRTLRRNVPCAFDPTTMSVPFGGATGTERHSARNLLLPTFGEELRRQSPQPTRIVSVAQKPRSSVTFAGRGHADTIAIFEEDDGTWATSAAYTSKPWTEVDEFVRAHPMKAAYGSTWDRLMPLSSYKFVDDGVGEGKVVPWTPLFPKPLTSVKGVPDNQFVTAWEKSPLNDEFLTNLAIHLLKARGLGTGAGTDVLTLSLPSLDHIGHEFGPRSHEVQDVLARADVIVGRLLDAIEAQVGDNYVLGFSGDHGVAVVPEQMKAEGADAGRISVAEINDNVDEALVELFGEPGNYAAVVWDSQVGLAPGVMDRLRQTRNGFRTVKEAILRTRGVAKVLSSDDVIAGAASNDPVMKAWRLSYVPGRSGDFLMTPKPNWIIRGAGGTTHGSMHSYDQRVPLLFYGGRIRAGRFDTQTTPADLAPTLMALTGVTMPRAQGRSLARTITR